MRLALSHKSAVRVMRRGPSSWRRYAQMNNWDKPLWYVCWVYGAYRMAAAVEPRASAMKSLCGSEMARFGSEPQTLPKSIKLGHRFQSIY